MRRGGRGVTWQGWLSLAAFLVVVIGIVSISRSRIVWMPVDVVATVAFLALCFAKGERPGWRWGRRD